MQHAEAWKPSKFVQRNGAWRASLDPTQVSVASRIMCARIAMAYTAAIATHARGDLLDLGCGQAPLYGAYRSVASSVTCVDRRNGLHGSEYVDVAADLGEPLPLESQSFDTVIFTDVLEHLPYPDEAWREVARVLRPGGVAIVGVPFLYWLHEEPHDHHRYTAHRLRLFCEDHELDIVSLEPYGGATDVLFDTAAKLLASRRLTRWLAGSCTYWGERLGRTRATTTTPLPLGYLLVARRAAS